MNHYGKRKEITKKSIRGILILYSIILFLINFFRIFDNSFWADECYSINLLKMGFFEMMEETGGDVHPPLYYIILRFVSFILGQKGWVFHLASLIPVGLTMLFSVTKVYQQFGVGVAFLLTTFTFFLDNAILFSVEVRMYSWANFFVLMSFFQIHEIIMKNRKKDWVLFLFYSLAAAYTHYYALLAVAFLYVMLIIYMIWKKGKDRERILTVCFTAVVLYMPWLLNLLQAFGRTTDNWWLEEIPEFRYCIRYLFSSKISLWYIGIWGIGITVLFYNTYIKKRECFEFTFFVIAGLVSIIGTISVGEIISILWRPMFQMKYSYVTAGMAWLMFGIVVDRLKNKEMWTIGILAVTCMIGIPNYYNWVKNDIKYKLGTQEILESTKDMEMSEVLWTNSEHLNWTMLEYYYPNNKCILIEQNFTETDLENADWVFWNEELKALGDYKAAEGYMGPYNYVYVYRMK